MNTSVLSLDARGADGRYMLLVGHCSSANEHNIKTSGMPDCACGLGCGRVGGRAASIRCAEFV